MAIQNIKSQKVPYYFAWRIYFIAVIIFVMLVFPISMIMLFKYAPYWLEEQQHTSVRNNTNIANTNAQFSHNQNVSDTTKTITLSKANGEAVEPEDLKFLQTISLLFRTILLSFILGFAWNYPFKRFFTLKRKNKKINDSLLLFCRKWLLKVPLINALILGFGFALPLTLKGYQIFGTTTYSTFSQDFYELFFIIAIVSSFLAVIFIFLWFRHRVRFIYLEHVYDSVSLYKSNNKPYRKHIIKRLWMNSVISTLLPLAIVIFYLSFSTTSIREAGNTKLSGEQIEILFGKYVPFIEQANMFQNENLFYVNAIDSLLMFVGIFSGIFVSVLYLFFFVNWTHHSIVIPVNEVIEKMRQEGNQGLDRMAILRTTDELGELSNGYNEMAMRISRHINELKSITEANQRFVPIEFLQMLEKSSITEVRLGDQIQKRMTVLFADIKSFTALSEKLTPKENFDFLNNYLGFMEPIIRAHGGFIDKFIGDSIMALFGNKVENAVDAALEMRKQLAIFNLELQQNGQLPIETGVGIHTGNLMLGVVGGAGRMETTVISDAVNLASRLEGLTRDYQVGIILSDDSLREIENKDRYCSQYLGEVTVKGRVKPVKIFTITEYNI